jgi:hypothetical protein
MVRASHSEDRRTPSASSIISGHRPRARLARRLRFDRTRGFWLGGFVLGTAGCILGACLPYHHPVAVTISALWWGIFFGCFGASLGALVGLWAEQPSAPPPPGWDSAGRPPPEADNPASPVPEVYLCAVEPTGSDCKFLHQVLALRAFPCGLGRHRGCDHRLACRFISRRHCGFLVRGGRVWVEDLGSRHGTHLNGQPLEEGRPLHDGDRLVLGCLPFEVRLSSRSGQARG